MSIRCRIIIAGWPSAPGVIKYVGREGKEGTYVMLFCCPCGCGETSTIDFDTGPEVRQPKWKWNNDKKKPTLTPSLNKARGCRWHGWLRDGVFLRV